MTSHEGVSLLARARGAAEAIRPLAPAIESARGLPPDALQALVRAGVFKMYVPAAYGGGATSLATGLGVLEEVARADGSAGWCAMIGATSGLMAAFLDDDVARTIYGPNDAISSGVFAPAGRAVRVDGGYRVSGRWSFASGCEHAGWRMGGALVEGGEPDLLPSGAPNVQSMIFRASETRVIDTWTTSGLRGTGSHDFEVRDVFVPASRTLSLLRDRPRHDAALYRLPFFGVLAANVAAVAIGIAQSAVDAFVELAKTKRPPGGKRTIAHRELVQLDVAEAEAKVAAGRALLREAVARVELEGDTTLPARARLRLAAYHAVRESAAAVDLMYSAGGAGSVYATSPLQRHFRDVHVATQHLMVNRTSAGLAGRILLDLPSDTDTL